MTDDFLTDVETSIITLLETDDYVKQYNWQRWDSDGIAELPRGILTIEGRRDPEGSSIFRLATTIRFEGRPKKSKLSVVMSQLKALFEATPVASLNSDTLNFFGNYAEEVEVRRENVAGVRVWILSFVLFATAA